MQKSIVIIIIVLILGAGIYYFVSGNKQGAAPAGIYQSTTLPAVNDTQTSTSTPVSNPQTAPLPAATAPATVSVSIKNFSFNPGALSIQAGTKVTWTNDDTVTHTVTADSGNLFNSGTLSPGQSFSFVFTTPGSVSYHCAIHPMMKATVTVQ